MRLTLVKDNGELIDSWYVPDEETPVMKLRNDISNMLPVYTDREEYEEILAEENQ